VVGSQFGDLDHRQQVTLGVVKVPSSRQRHLSPGPRTADYPCNRTSDTRLILLPQPTPTDTLALTMHPPLNEHRLSSERS
jgi:hypothetical protein